MYCQNCGTQVEDGAAFCPKCGKKVESVEALEKVDMPKEEKTQKKKKGGCLKYALVAVGVFLITCIGLSMCGGGGTEDSAGTREETQGDPEIETDHIAMVQSGYLGEFTDAEVKDILDTNFDLSGFTLDWTNKEIEGREYVGFHAYAADRSLDDGTIILFQICSEDTFKVAGYAVGDNEDFESAEIADLLNEWYMNWYVKNKIGSDAKEDEIMEGMRGLIYDSFNKISGSAVLYGASKDYSGDRSGLCRVIDSIEPMDMSVTELINYYSDNMLNIYTAGEENPEKVTSGLQYGYYGNTGGTYAVTIEPDGSSDGGVFSLYEYSASDSVYYNIWSGSVIPDGDSAYEAVDGDGLMALKLTFDGVYLDIVIDYNDMDVLAGLEGRYEPAEEAPVTADTNTVQFLASDELRGFARDNTNIGRTVSFSAEVSMSYLDIYLLNVFDDNGLLQIQASAVNGLNLYDGDGITYTGVYNGTIPETNQLSFTTVSIEIQ